MDDLDKLVQEQLQGIRKDYRIIERAGAGAFGIVYKIKNEHGDILALKVLAIPESGKLTVMEAVKTLGVNGILNREKAAKEFHHPHIIHISESFSIDIGSVSIPCVVQEYIEAPSLEEILVKSSLPEHERDSLMLGIASAVGYMHERSWVHRDIKPANIINGLLTDFSIAEKVNNQGRIIEPVPAKQSAKYSAPEAGSSYHNARRADVWSLGILMCSVFAGRIPQNRREIQFIVNTLIPHRYGPIVKKCLEVDPTGRYANGTGVYKALRKAQHYYARLCFGTALVGGALASLIVGTTVYYQTAREEQAALYAEQCRVAVDLFPVRAEQLCRNALALNVSVDALVSLGHSLVLQTRYEEARGVYDEAYAINPEILKQLRLKAKDIIPSCVPVLLEYVYQKEQREEDGIALIHAYLENNRYKDAAALLHQQYWNSITKSEYLAIAEYYEQMQNWQEALYFLHSALTVVQQEAEKPRISVVEGREDILLLERDVSNNKVEEAEILFRIGDALSNDGQYSAAISAYKKANIFIPKPEVFVRIAKLWYNEGNVSAAQGALHEAEVLYDSLVGHARYEQGIISEKIGFTTETDKLDGLVKELQHVKELQRQYQ